jgi:hypothetical protein
MKTTWNAAVLKDPARALLLSVSAAAMAWFAGPVGLARADDEKKDDRGSASPVVISIPLSKGPEGGSNLLPRSITPVFIGGDDVLATFSRDYVGLWRVSDGTSILALDGHFGHSPGGGMIVTTSPDLKSVLRDGKTGKMIMAIQRPLGVIANDGKLSASLIPAGKPIVDRTPPSSGPKRAPAPKTATPNPAPSGSPSGSLRPEGTILNVPPGGYPDFFYNPPHVFLEDARTGARKGLLFARIAPTDEDIGVSREENNSKFLTAQFSPRMDRLAAILDNGVLNIWDLKPPGNEPRAVKIDGLEPEGDVMGRPVRVTWSPDGASVFVHLRNAICRVNAATNELDRPRIPASDTRLPSESPEPEPERDPVPSGGKGRPFPMPSLSPGDGPKSRDAGSSIRNVFSDDGTLGIDELIKSEQPEGMLRVAPGTSQLALLDIAGNQFIGRFALPDGERAERIAFSPSGQTLAVSTSAGVVYVLPMIEARRLAAAGGTLVSTGRGDQLVENPIVRSWQGRGVGSTIEIQTVSSMDGVEFTQTVVTELLERDDKLGLTRKTYDKAKGNKLPRDEDLAPALSRFNVPARVTPSQADRLRKPGPVDAPWKLLRTENVAVSGRDYKCNLWQSLTTSSDGIKSDIRVWMCDDVPELLVKRVAITTEPRGVNTVTQTLISITEK